MRRRREEGMENVRERESARERERERETERERESGENGLLAAALQSVCLYVYLSTSVTIYMCMYLQTKPVYVPANYFARQRRRSLSIRAKTTALCCVSLQVYWIEEHGLKLPSCVCVCVCVCVCARARAGVCVCVCTCVHHTYICIYLSLYIYI
jgi:hypothetical protein